MKKILGLTIAALLVIGLVVGGTLAYFSDTEDIPGNTFTAGTIDLTVTGGGTVTVEGSIDDMKPSQTGYLLVTLTNAGLNPLELWKKIDVTENTTGVVAFPPGDPEATNEPEWIAEGGETTWVGKDDIDKYMHFDMWIENGTTPYVFSGTDKMIVDEAVDGFLVTTNANTGETSNFIPGVVPANNGVAGLWIYLGPLPIGGTINITQSFHMDGYVGNWAQGDVMTFTETFFAQQTVGDPQPAPPGTELSGHGRADWPY